LSLGSENINENDLNNQNEEDGIQVINEKKKNKRQENESVCYLRAKWMYEPLPLPPKINKKINYVL
jgi:hypothetical protein